MGQTLSHCGEMDNRIELSEASQAILSAAGGGDWETFDLCDAEDMALKLEDEGLAAMLGVIDAGRHLKFLRLVQCPNLEGNCLVHLQGSNTLQIIAFDSLRHNEAPQGDLVKPGMRFIINTILGHEDNSVFLLQVPPVSFNNTLHTLRSELGYCRPIIKSPDSGCIYLRATPDRVTRRLHSDNLFCDLDWCYLCQEVTNFRCCVDCKTTFRCTCSGVSEGDSEPLICELCGSLSCENCKLMEWSDIVQCREGHTMCERCRFDHCERDREFCDHCRLLAADYGYLLNDHHSNTMAQQNSEIASLRDMITSARDAATGVGGAEQRLHAVCAALGLHDDIAGDDEQSV